MQINNIEVTFSLLYCILIFFLVITIINFIYLDNQSSTLYIQAQSISSNNNDDNNNNNNNNNSNDTNEQGVEKKKEEVKEDKEKEKEKNDNDNKNKQDIEKKEEEQNNNNKEKEEKEVIKEEEEQEEEGTKEGQSKENDKKEKENINNDSNDDDKEKEKESQQQLEQQQQQQQELTDSWTKADEDLITKYNYRNLAIPKVYPSIPDGESYRFNKTNPNDKVQVDKTDKSNVFTKQNKDGSWRIEYGKPRVDIHTRDAGVLPDKPEQLNNLSKGKIQSWNYSKLKDIGYWYKPSDWKNIEITLIFKLLDSSRSKGEDHAVSLVTRSITHSQLDSEYKKSDDEPKFFCGGSSYHNNLSNDGKIRMKKEQFHINYEWERYNDINNLSVGNIYDKIIGFKAIVYNINNTAVKLESWIDAENGGKGPYKKVHELIDNGDWGDAMTECDAKTNGQAITWGSPIVILKANDFLFDIYDIEVREINPPPYSSNSSNSTNSTYIT
jgi:outer membrane biosynthesis protein TonB